MGPRVEGRGVAAGQLSPTPTLRSRLPLSSASLEISPSFLDSPSDVGLLLLSGHSPPTSPTKTPTTLPLSSSILDFSRSKAHDDYHFRSTNKDDTRSMGWKSDEVSLDGSVLQFSRGTDPSS